MITLTATTNGVEFTFTDSKYYLYGDGTINVPLNSLSLVLDNSGAATFKKAASNDVFVSAPLSEFGMTKAELEAFYKENMVGGGVDPADVLDIVESATSYYDGVEYDSVNSRINFKHGNTIEAYVDAAPFIVDGMVDNVAISGGNLVITFNTDSGKQPISIPLTDIFDPNNYYNKTAIDTIVSGINDSIIDDEEVISSALNDLNERKLDASAYTPTDLSNYYNKTEVNGLLDGKQDELTAGSGITISGNVISVDGGVNVVQTTGTSTADVMSQSAVTNAFNTYTVLKNSDNGIVRYWSWKTPNYPYGNVLINNFAINGRCPLSQENGVNNYIWKFNLVETSAITSSVTSASTDTEIPSAKAVYDALGQGGGGSASSAITSGDTNPVQGGAVYDKFDEVEQVTAAALNLLNTNIDNLNTNMGGLKFVKLSQQEYDALTTKDNNTLYVIVD